MIVIKKTYDNFEDFDEQIRQGKPDEIFYNYTPKVEASQVRKDVSMGKDAQGNDIVDSMMVAGHKVVFVISIQAVLKNDGETLMVGRHFDISDAAYVTTQQEMDAQTANVKTTMDELIKLIQKNHAGTFLRKGNLELEG